MCVALSRSQMHTIITHVVLYLYGILSFFLCIALQNLFN